MYQKGLTDKQKKPWCEHSKKPWHTKETCWKLCGKPLNWKRKSGGDGRAFQATTEESLEHQINLETVPFTKEQLKHLYKLYQSPKLSINPSCSLAQKGNYFTITSLSVIPNSINPWIIDSGATNHMKSCSKLFSSYNPCAGNKKVKIADGSLSAIVKTESIQLSPSLILHNVLHVPNLSCNLLSISKITLKHKCHANIYTSYCEFQELISGRTIGNAREC